jgi:hypothetical protein
MDVRPISLSLKNRSFAMKKWCFFCFFWGMFAFSCSAQSDDPFKEMEQAFQKMMDQMRAGMALGPGRDTTIYFKWDTVQHQNGNGSFFFRFNPHTLGIPPGTEFDFYEEMDSLTRQLDRAMFGRSQPMPADDGGNSKNEDGLLPEERLRLEEQQKLKTPAPKSVPKPVDKSSKIKTTRI